MGLIYENEEKGFVLPRSIQTFLRDWEVVDVENSKINLDLTTVLTEETREKQSLEEAHTVEINPVQIQILPEALGVAEAALKVLNLAMCMFADPNTFVDGHWNAERGLRQRRGSKLPEGLS